jgi:HD-like signal output (HDOD) protein
LALLSFFPKVEADILRCIREQDLFRDEAERLVLSFDHGDIGAALCRHWGLPESICYLIEHHHADHAKRLDPANVEKLDLAAGVLQVAQAVTCALDLSFQNDLKVEPFSDQVWTGLYRNEAQIEADLRSICTQYDLMSNLIS